MKLYKSAIIKLQTPRLTFIFSFLIENTAKEWRHLFFELFFELFLLTFNSFGNKFCRLSRTCLASPYFMAVNFSELLHTNYCPLSVESIGLVVFLA